MSDRPETSLTLEDVARLVGGVVHGDPAFPVPAACGLDGMQPGAMTFAENPRGVRAAEESLAGSLLAPAGTTSRLPTVQVGNPRLAFALLLEHFHPPRRAPQGVHCTATVHPTAVVAPDSHVGPCAVLGPEVQVGPGCEVHARAVLEARSQIGPGTRVLPGAFLGAGCQVGRDGLVGPLTSLAAGTVVGDDVEIGARCRLDRCTIETGCRLDNLVRIGEGAHVGPCAILVSQSYLGPGARLGRYAILAAQAMVCASVTVGEGAQVAGRARATTDLPPGQAAWAGDPAVPHREELRREARRGQALDLVRTLRRNR